MTLGDQFEEEEINEFIKDALKENNNGKINYEGKNWYLSFSFFLFFAVVGLLVQHIYDTILYDDTVLH